MRFWSLQGLVSYEAVRELQLSLVERRFQGKIPDTVLFLEHEPVITQGRGLQFTGTLRPKHMPTPQFMPKGMSFSESERGGDLTYHGPGQLVIYPILQLNGEGFAPNRNIAGFLRKFENLLISYIGDQGVSASFKENATGVWIGEKKVASFGIAIRKWVSYHGIAINCVNDLSPFHLISPCGFSPDVMTRLSDWIDLGPEWRNALEKEIARRMFSLSGLEPIQSLSLERAFSLLA